MAEVTKKDIPLLVTPLQVYKQYTFSGMQDEVLIRVNDPDGDTYSLRAEELLYEGISSLALSDYPRDGYTGLVRTESLSPNKLSSAYRIQVNGAGREIQYPLLKFSDDTVTPELTNEAINDHRFIPIDIAQYNRLNDDNERPFEDELYYYRQGDFIYLYPITTTIGKLLITYVASPREYVNGSIMNNEYSLDFIYKVIEYATGRIKEQQAGE
jgi:hypothetical protein